MLKRTLLALTLVFAGQSVALAQITQDTPVFVIDLFGEPHRAAVVRASSLNDALKDPTDQPGTATPLERLVGACKPPVPEAARPLITKLQQCGECLSAAQEKRFITKRGDVVVLLAIYNAAKVRPEEIRPFFVETARDSELIATAKALRPFVAETEAVVSCEAFTYTLQRTRSKFKVILPVPEGAATVPSRTLGGAPTPATGGIPPELVTTKPPPAASASTTAQIHTPEVTLGPPEKWFLSADFSFSDAAVKLGEDPQPGEEELKAKDFFIALNFAFSDLLVDRDSPMQKRGLLDELVAKVQFTPSKRPWESWAVGLGVRGYRIRTILWNMDIVHPYVSIGRQAPENGGDPVWRFGFGLGFDPRAINRQK
jgi:hypothetical protein